MYPAWPPCDNRQSLAISSITATFTRLTAQYHGDDFSRDGILSISPATGYASVDGGNVIITMDMLFKDNVTAKTYKLKDFSITRTTTTAAVSYEDIIINGRYYDPDEGYVDLSTPIPLRLTNDDQGRQAAACEPPASPAAPPSRRRATAPINSTSPRTATAAWLPPRAAYGPIFENGYPRTGRVPAIHSISEG